MNEILKLMSRRGDYLDMRQYRQIHVSVFDVILLFYLRYIEIYFVSKTFFFLAMMN